MPSLLGEDPRVIPNKRNTTVPTGQGLLDAAALLTTPVPVLGDIAGLLADASMIRNDPTWGNVGLAAAGVLPFVPAGSVIKKLPREKIPIYKDRYGNDVVALQNPSDEQIYRLRRDARSELLANGVDPNREVLTRKTYDENGNMWVWKASDMTHDHVETTLKDRFNLKGLHQQNPEYR